jgi:hypothetical protein
MSFLEMIGKRNHTFSQSSSYRCRVAAFDALAEMCCCEELGKLLISDAPLLLYTLDTAVVDPSLFMRSAACNLILALATAGDSCVERLCEAGLMQMFSVTAIASKCGPVVRFSHPMFRADGGEKGRAHIDDDNESYGSSDNEEELVASEEEVEARLLCVIELVSLACSGVATNFSGGYVSQGPPEAGTRSQSAVGLVRKLGLLGGCLQLLVMPPGGASISSSVSYAVVDAVTMAMSADAFVLDGVLDMVLFEQLVATCMYLVNTLETRRTGVSLCAAVGTAVQQYASLSSIVGQPTNASTRTWALFCHLLNLAHHPTTTHSVVLLILDVLGDFVCADTTERLQRSNVAGLTLRLVADSSAALARTSTPSQLKEAVNKIAAALRLLKRLGNLTLGLEASLRGSDGERALNKRRRKMPVIATLTPTPFSVVLDLLAPSTATRPPVLLSQALELLAEWLCVVVDAAGDWTWFTSPAGHSDGDSLDLARSLATALLHHAKSDRWEVRDACMKCLGALSVHPSPYIWHDLGLLPVTSKYCVCVCLCVCVCVCV